MAIGDKFRKNVVISLPLSMGRRVEDMAYDREMSLDQFLSELVQVGLIAMKQHIKAPIGEPLRGVDPSAEGEY